MPLVQFTPFTSQVEPTLWHAYSQRKLNEIRLEDESIPFSAEYAPAKRVWDKVSESYVGLGCRLRLDAAGLGHASSSTSAMVVRIPGTLKNFNTLEEFKQADKQAYLYRVADAIWDAVHTDTASFDVNALNQALLLTYMDLKSYRYYYWFAFPALITREAPWHLDGEWQSCVEAYGDAWFAARAEQLLDRAHMPAWLVMADEGGAWRFSRLADGERYCRETPVDKQTLLFIDPSPHAQSPGWPLRNMLTYLSVRFSISRIRVICWKDSLASPDHGAPSSVVGTIFQEGERRAARVTYRPGTMLPDAVGWERNAQERLAPKLISLGAMLDPKMCVVDSGATDRRLAEHAVDLNLKLMRWRAMPELDLGTIQSTKALIIGAGTLGSYMARTLMVRA